MYYRVAIKGTHPATWRWKSIPFTSLHGVLDTLKLYHCVPNDHIRVFLSSSTAQMEEMLSLVNQEMPSTALRVDQLWDKDCTNWTQVRRLEIELGAGGDHDQAYTWSLPPSGPQILAWTKLQALREHGEFEP